MTPRRVGGQDAGGFTLLELLIAIAIFALLGLGTYRMLDSVLRSDEATRNQEQVLRELSRAVWTLERDLLQVIARPVRDGNGESLPALRGESDPADGDTAFELTRSGWRNPTGLARSQLQRVRWRLVGDNLERVYWVVLDRAVDSAPRVQKVLTGVSALTVRYLDKDGAWQTDWPPTQSSGAAQQQSLPQALELTLTHRRYGQVSRLLRLPEWPTQAATGAAVDPAADPDSGDGSATSPEPAQDDGQ